MLMIPTLLELLAFRAAVNPYFYDLYKNYPQYSLALNRDSNWVRMSAVLFLFNKFIFLEYKSNKKAFGEVRLFSFNQSTKAFDYTDLLPLLIWPDRRLIVRF